MSSRNSSKSVSSRLRAERLTATGRCAKSVPSAVPLRHLGADHLEHVAGEPLDQPGVLRQRDEVVGRDVAALGVLPAQQRLGADDLAGRQVDLRLVVDRQLVGAQRVAQVAQQLQPLGRAALITGPVQQRPEMRRLRRVHGRVGTLHELGDVCRHGRAAARCRCSTRRADAGRRWRRLRRRSSEPDRQPFGVQLAADVRGKYGELVAAEAGDGVGVAHDLGKAPTHLLEQRITPVVAQGCR